ncbi:MAG: hypothetical protein A2289_21695 [Deltaproteobacteria bacterium RIFOXYA12_FULL_58_15]|nr:MAG: hypothetical protein A2289_21695 [Deltaproteobacteria bacterium RIFOXYA12_FULL_58_15]OGR09527.1 MAG: hypothetical protein A2341_16570 [Deltaproteobacteria bacterium RIFOXYB12_FULL_58_9]
MPVQPQRIPAEIAAILDELLVTEMHERSGMRVIGSSDINAMIGLEKMKSALGCDDVSCAAEIGGALGVDLMLSGAVSRLGNELIITLKLVDIGKTEIRERLSLRVPNDETNYAKGIGDAVTRLLHLDAKPTAPAAEASAKVPSEPVESMQTDKPAIESGPTTAETEPPTPEEKTGEPTNAGELDWLNNGIAIGFAMRIAGWDVPQERVNLDPNGETWVSFSGMGAAIQYRRRHGSFFATTAQVYLLQLVSEADNLDADLDLGEEGIQSKEEGFSAGLGIHEEFGFSLWRAQRPWFGTNPSFDLYLLVGVDAIFSPGDALVPTLIIPGGGFGVRFGWLSSEMFFGEPIADNAPYLEGASPGPAVGNVTSFTLSF